MQKDDKPKFGHFLFACHWNYVFPNVRSWFERKMLINTSGSCTTSAEGKGYMYMAMKTGCRIINDGTLRFFE